MAGSSYGTIFRITTWGESHGAGVGVVIDGCPAGLPLSEEDIQKYLNRRKPGQSKFTTQRKESDQAEILSGVFEGRTTGTPISILVRNQDQKSRDYSNIMNTYRPWRWTFFRARNYRSCSCRCCCMQDSGISWHPGYGLHQVHRTGQHSGTGL